MSERAAAAHWQKVYEGREPRRLSWYEPIPAASLGLIGAAGIAADAAIIDAGGGTSRLAAELLRRGYADITVVDVSAEALARAKAELGDDAARIAWLQADLREGPLPRRYDLWHDRAAFHFMVAEADRDAYLVTLRRHLNPGGHVILATFGLEGPTSCSELPVARYGADELAALLGDGFDLLSAELVDHRTPSGTQQQFLYAHLRSSAEP